MKNPYFSVVIPTLNEEKYVPKLLGDLVRQKTSVPFEVIVVDSYSEDETIASVRKFKDSFISLSIFNTKIRNQAYQRNYGGSKATGKYIIFIDADSRVDNRFITHLYKSTKKYKNLVFLPKIIPQEQSYIDDTLFTFGNYFVELSQIVGKPLPTAGCMIFQKDFFIFIGGYKAVDSKKFLYPDDHDLILRTRKAGVIAQYLRDISVKFSLRRLKKEGRLTVSRKYFISTIEMLIKGELQTRVKYEMGGQYYVDSHKADKYSKKKLGYYLKKISELKDQILNFENTG